GGLAGVVAAEGDGGGVLVQLLQADVKIPDGAQDQGGQQAGTVGTSEVVQGPADAVVVEQADLAGLQPQVLGDAPGHPPGDGVQRLPGQQQVGEQDGEGDGRGQGRRAAGQRRQVLLE